MLAVEESENLDDFLRGFISHQSIDRREIENMLERFIKEYLQYQANVLAPEEQEVIWQALEHRKEMAGLLCAVTGQERSIADALPFDRIRGDRVIMQHLREVREAVIACVLTHVYLLLQVACSPAVAEQWGILTDQERMERLETIADQVIPPLWREE